jgi:hypothetical protein
MYSVKIIARSSMPTPLATSEQIQYGIGQLSNEDPATQARVLFQGNDNAPSVADVMLGARLYPAGGNQTQTQEVNGGTHMEWVWVAVAPEHAVAPGATIEDNFADVLLVGSNNRAVSGKRAALMASFTQPAVDATVQIAVSDTSPFAVDDTIYVEGGTIYTVASIDSATTMTITNTGEAAAVVTLCES